MSYSESVLQHADDMGVLDGDVVHQLLEEHGTSTDVLLADGFNPELIDNAEELLHWLGY